MFDPYDFDNIRSLLDSEFACILFLRNSASLPYYNYTPSYIRYFTHEIFIWYDVEF